MSVDKEKIKEKIERLRFEAKVIGNAYIQSWRTETEKEHFRKSLDEIDREIVQLEFFL